MSAAVATMLAATSWAPQRALLPVPAVFLDRTREHALHELKRGRRLRAPPEGGELVQLLGQRAAGVEVGRSFAQVVMEEFIRGGVE